MAISNWPEINQAKNETRHELVLNGSLISERIEEEGLCNEIYSLTSLNFLEINRTCLNILSADLGNLVNLTNLVLHGNKLETLPESIKNLKKLKFLDISSNDINTLPDEIGQLTELESFNVNCNNLNDFPDVGDLLNLHILDISHNELCAFPDGIISTAMSHLAQIIVSDNIIEEIPSELSDLPSLKLLDVSNNKITTIPPELCDCTKLKDFKFGGNKLKDRRLAKMMDQCSTKAVLDYLKGILQKQGGGKGNKNKKKNAKQAKQSETVEQLTKNLINVLKFPNDEGVTIQVTNSVADVRPYIVCCIVRDINLQKSPNLFKRFISDQTKLHDGVCQKRQVATIATHDLKQIKSPLCYDAKSPEVISLIPLFKSKEITADKLVSKLKQEAEEKRKEAKRNTISGIHKYLDLLTGKVVYPCLIDNDGTVISFPPITNCDKTKVSKETTDLMIEVTSNVNLETCKNVMETVLKELLQLGVGRLDDESLCNPNSDVPLKLNQKLIVEQVKILNPEGLMKVVYPSRTDLNSDEFEVVKNYD